MTKFYYYLTCGLILIALCVSFYAKCSPKPITNNGTEVIGDISNLSNINKFGFNQTVTIKPRESQDGNRGDESARLVQPLIIVPTQVSIQSRKHNDELNYTDPFLVSTAGITNIHGSESTVNPFCSRRGCYWSYTTGSITYDRYNFSFAPGIEVFWTKGMGVDTRFFRIGDFGSVVGAAYFTKTKEVQPSIGLTYNLRRVRVLSNCDLFVSYTPKTWIGGLRVELGEFTYVQ